MSDDQGFFREAINVAKEYWELLTATSFALYWSLKMFKFHLFDRPRNFEERIMAIEKTYATTEDLKECQRGVIDCINKQVQESAHFITQDIRGVVKEIHKRLDDHIDRSSDSEH